MDCRKGEHFQSINAATNEVVWQGRAATAAQVKPQLKPLDKLRSHGTSNPLLSVAHCT